jgi:hypothetical protein
MIHLLIIWYVLTFIIGMVFFATIENTYMKFINTKFVPNNNCYINSSTPFESLNNNSCYITGFTMNIIVVKNNETKYATACTSSHVVKKLKDDALCDKSIIYPYERTLKLGNMPMYYCSECGNNCSAYSHANKNSSCLLSTKITYNGYYDAFVKYDSYGNLVTNEQPYFPHTGYTIAIFVQYMCITVVTVVFSYMVIDTLIIKINNEIKDYMTCEGHIACNNNHTYFGEIQIFAYWNFVLTVLITIFMFFNLSFTWYNDSVDFTIMVYFYFWYICLMFQIVLITYSYLTLNNWCKYFLWICCQSFTQNEILKIYTFYRIIIITVYTVFGYIPFTICIMYYITYKVPNITGFVVAIILPLSICKSISFVYSMYHRQSIIPLHSNTNALLADF